MPLTGVINYVFFCIYTWYNC